MEGGPSGPEQSASLRTGAMKLTRMSASMVPGDRPQGWPGKWTTASNFGVAGANAGPGNMQWFLKGMLDLFARGLAGDGMSPASVWVRPQLGLLLRKLWILVGRGWK